MLASGPAVPAAAGQTEHPGVREAAADDALWHYTPSNDGLSHYLNLTAVSAEVRTPFGVLTTARWPGQQSPTLFGFCREGEQALHISLALSAHPDEPVTPSVSLRGLWWDVTGTTPPPSRWETTMTLGAAVFETAFELPAVRYIEAEYSAVVDAQRAAEQLLAGGEQDLRSTGRIGVDAQFRVPEGYRDRLRQMVTLCGAGGEERRR